MPPAQSNQQATENSWKTALQAYFKPGRKSMLPRPVREFLICEEHKLLYAPVAKCACTSIKHLMAELSNIPHTDLILEHGVHQVTNSFQTGLLLKDHDMNTVRTALESDEYYRFAVIRDPVSRVVSAYTEKFWNNRMSPANQLCTRIPLRAVQSTMSPDFERSITFREFTEYLLAANPRDLDAHWGYQFHYLAGPASYDRVFTIKQLDQLANKLSELSGRAVTFEQLNPSTATTDISPQREPGGLVDTLAPELDATLAVNSNDFLEPRLVARLMDYYQADQALYDEASGQLENYRPASIELESDGQLVEPPEIAKAVNLYSKGFLGTNCDGEGVLPIVIENRGSKDLGFSTLSSCHLLYVPMDREGNALCSPLKYPVDPGRLGAHSTTQIDLSARIPRDLLDSVTTLKVSLLLGESCYAEDFAPLHVTTAQLLQI